MTPAERLRKNQRMLDKAIRELDQTRVKLEKQEKTLIQQIKTSAKNGQMGACKIQAKDLVRTRRYIEKFFSMRSQLQKISLRLQVRRAIQTYTWGMLGEFTLVKNKATADTRHFQNRRTERTNK